jgi:very-short-patch-repair endonuclease
MHEGKSPFAGVVPWNKGLTKRDHPTIARLAAEAAERLAGVNPVEWTDELRAKQSELKRKLYDEFPEKHPNRKLAGNRAKMTYPERLCFDWLIAHEIKFEPQFKINGWFIDFRVGTLLIEIDGEYWHRDEERDRKRDEFLIAAGYDVKRIKASEKIEERLQEIFGA